MSTEKVDDFDSAFDEFSTEDETTSAELAPEDTEFVAETEEVEEVEAATEEPEQAPEADIWAEADEGLKSEYDKLRDNNDKLSHQAKSNAGRIGALQRKLNEFQATSPAGGNQPSATEVAEAMKTPEAWASFNEEYPDIHDAIESRLEMERSQNQETMNRALQPLRAAEEERHVSNQYAALEAAHTDWKDVVNSESFVDWLQEQPNAIQELSNSNDAFEASKLLDYYKLSQPLEEIATTSTVTSIQQKRAKQLEDSTGVKSKPGPGATGVIPPDDFDTAFEMFAADNR
tara:strand:+ start:124 stop:987 length:864 start_codon:yes stop_codon:yes gene_type:complete